MLGTEPRLLPSEYYAYPGLKGARFHVGGAAISLVASEKADSPIARFLRERGEGVNHISLEVVDIEQDVRNLAAKGVRFLGDKPRAFSEGKVIFAHPDSLHGVQIAFVQANQDTDLLRGDGADERISR